MTTATFIVLIVVSPIMAGSGVMLNTLEVAIVYCIGAMTLDFAYGYGGELALSQPVLMSVGAYTAALLSIHLGLSFWETALPSAAAGAAASVLLGLPSVRIRGWYFAILTFFVVLVFPAFVELDANVTGGDNGLAGVKPITIGGNLLAPWEVYELFAIIGLITWFGLRALLRSDWGVSLQTMRDYPVAARSFGVSLVSNKLRLYVVVGLPCGLIGAIYAHNIQSVAPDTFGLDMLLLLVGAVFVGGKGTLYGPLLGVVIFEAIAQEVGPFSEYNPLFLGLGVLVAAVIFRGGIVGLLSRATVPCSSRVRRGKPGEGVELAGAVKDPPSYDSGRGWLLGSERRLVRTSPGSEKDVLRVEGVAKAFGGNVVLEKVSLSVREGEVVGLIGANGSGKTTLLNIVTGFVRPDGGRIFLGDLQCAGKAPEALARLGISRTFQVPKLVGNLSVLRNVELSSIGRTSISVFAALVPWWPGRTARRADRLARIEQLCETLHLEIRWLTQRAMSLPLGHKRLAEVVRAGAAGSRLVCLDEPAAGLSESERKKLVAGVRELASSGKGVLVVEHNGAFIRDVCDRILLLERGIVVAEGEPAVPGSLDGPIGHFFEKYRLPGRGDGHEPRVEVHIERVFTGATPESGDGALHVEGVNSWYGEARVLVDISLEAPSGQLLAIVGANGAGKTTLLRTIAGLHRETSGSILLGSEPLDGLQAHSIAERGLSLVREGARVFEAMTVHEQLSLAERLARRRGAEPLPVDEVYSTFPMLARLRDVKGGYLSGGQRQTLALAVGFAGRPRCLLLDEPSTGLAPSVAEEVYKVILGLSERGITVIVVEEDPGWVRGIADRIEVLESGRLQLGIQAVEEIRRTDPVHAWPTSN